MLQIYYGDGKGKTTSAFGQAIRFLWHGKKVGCMQFLKCEKSGEVRYLSKDENFHSFCRQTSNKFFKFMTTEEQTLLISQVKDGFSELVKNSECLDLIILDEVLDVIDLRIIPETDIINFIEDNKDREIILTGRRPSEKLLQIADYVSMIACEKHPFSSGTAARQGVEF